MSRLLSILVLLVAPFGCTEAPGERLRSDVLAGYRHPEGDRLLGRLEHGYQVILAEQFPTGESATNYVWERVEEEIEIHESLLKPEWKMVGMIPQEPECGADSCTWMVYIGSSHKPSGFSQVWYYFHVNADTGEISVMVQDESVPLAKWEREFSENPH